MNFISTLLGKHEFPYLLTVIFAALSWNAVHLANRYMDTPIIEWQFNCETCKNKKVGAYHVRNLSRDSAFENLTFSLHSENGNFTSCRVIRIPPAGNVSVDYPNEDIFKNTQRMTKLEILVTQFHPKWELKFLVEVSNVKYPKLNIVSKKPVNLVESSWETFIIRNEINILWIFLGFWIALIVLYLIVLYRVKIGSDETEQVCKKSHLQAKNTLPEDDK